MRAQDPRTTVIMYNTLTTTIFLLLSIPLFIPEPPPAVVHDISVAHSTFVAASSVGEIEPPQQFRTYFGRLPRGIGEKHRGVAGEKA